LVSVIYYSLTLKKLKTKIKNKNKKIMKKLLLNLALLISLSAFSQTSKPFTIEHCKDKMTDKEYYFPEKKLICANVEKTKGFTISPNFKADNGTMSNAGFICKNVNIGSCDENDSLIILFEDQSKITLNSWNKFNCDGNAYFDFTDSELEQLSTKKVNTIRFTNGRSFESLTITLKQEQKDYFIRVYSNYKIVEVDCSK
jgi:hypothetical protein